MQIFRRRPMFLACTAFMGMSVILYCFKFYNIALYIGVVFAVLCLTIGVGKAMLIGAFCLIGAFIGGVKDKAGFARKVILFFHRDGSDRYE